MRTSRTAVTAVAAAVLAVACGGSGGGGSPEPQATYVLISAANQDTVARASLASMMPLLTAPVVPTAAQAATTATHGGLSQVLLRTARSGIRSPAADGMARPTTQYQAVYPCQVSGTLVYVWDDTDESATVSAGDSVLMTFSQCNDAPGLVFNGKLGMSIASYAATAGSEDLVGSLTYQSLTMADPAGSFSMNGGANFHINRTETASGVDMVSRYTVASGGLTVDKRSASGGLSDSFTYRAGYAVSDHDFSSAVGKVASSETITASGNFRAQSLGGELRLATTTPFRSVFSDLSGDIYPAEGQLIATGQNDTRLGLAATGTLQVRMDLCDDGDNAWDASRMVTWDWLLQ